MLSADQTVGLEIGFRTLNLVDRGLPLRHAEREVLLLDHFTAVEIGGGTGPIAHRAAIHVVRADEVDLRTDILDHPLHAGQDLLLAGGSGEEGVVVGDAALSLVVVPIDGLGPDDFAACCLPLSARIRGEHDVRFVIVDALLSEFLIALDGGLTVVADDLDLLLHAVDENAACLIDLVGGHLVRKVFWSGHD